MAHDEIEITHGSSVYSLRLTSGELFRKSGEKIHLTKQQRKLLLYFVSRPSELLSKENLGKELWGTERAPKDALTQAVGTLRRALADGSSEPESLVRTIHGEGYIFDGVVGDPKRQKSEPIAQANAVSAQPCLRYSRAANADEASLEPLLHADAISTIEYHPTVAEFMSSVDQYEVRPEPYLQRFRERHERVKKYDMSEADWDQYLENRYKEIPPLKAELQKLTLQNDLSLTRLLGRLREDSVPDELGCQALRIFASYAAVRVIVALKSFRDVKDGEPVEPFKHFRFRRTPSYCLFDLVPKNSGTGKVIFGFEYYTRARIYPRGWDEYTTTHIMLPFEIARRLFITNRTRDPQAYDQAFYEWVLPQLYLASSGLPAETFLPEKWGIILLEGDPGSWQSDLVDSPWKVFES
jgi:DNA-binding winged helix-turn-helix (wHTH) protein